MFVGAQILTNVLLALDGYVPVTVTVPVMVIIHLVIIPVNATLATIRLRVNLNA